MMHEKIAEAFPPGEFIMDELEARGWSQIQLADIIGCHPSVVNAWIKGKRAITPQTAKQLGDAFGTSAQLWLNHQTTYDLWKAEEVDAGIARRANLYKYGPINELTKRGWIEPSESIDVLEKRVCKFFGIPSLDQQPQVACAARKSTPGELTPPQTSWLCRAIQLARGVQAARFTSKSFEEAIRSLKPLLINVEDSRYVPEVLARHGIRLLIIEQLVSSSKIDGVTFWINEAPVIAISMRFDRIDSFWFTLAHELGHVKNRDGLASKILVDTDLVGEEADRNNKPVAERLADAFAAEFLVPQVKLESFIARKGPLFSEKKIINFASSINVHPGLVVGQLQNRGCFHWSHHRRMLEKVKHVITHATLTDGWGQIPSAVAA